ncbi:Putative Glycosyl hydrolase [Aspergillus calidoustus]|uniref:Putative Glycosyl hydrolase n=1 Tax=Aspergillus calidoustus TaxID=454130 RepID=A0A0U5G777_ASPCI|nr:Putative Glycosyl hydrolase [Aspergillus calidoustus]
MDRNRLYNVDVIGVLRGKYLTPAFGVKIGETAIRNCLRDQLKFLREESLRYMGNHPVIFSETGIPYDMDDKHAYKTGDYSSQISAMDAIHYALEGSTSNGFTLWVYTARNDHEWGDQWNGEDLSIYSVDDLELPSSKSLQDHELHSRSDHGSPSYSSSHHATNQEISPRNLKDAIKTPSITSEVSQLDEDKLGYRAAEAFIRPSPIYTNGLISDHVFDLKNCTFTMSLIGNPADVPTEIYLPDFHFPDTATRVATTAGKWSIDYVEFKHARFQRLQWWHPEGEQGIKIEGKKRKGGALAAPSAEDVSYLEQCQKGGCTVM